MSDIAWVAAALIAAVILLEVWFANQKLNEQLASVLFIIDSERQKRQEEEAKLVAQQQDYWAQFTGPITEDMINNQPTKEDTP